MNSRGFFFSSNFEYLLLGLCLPVFGRAGLGEDLAFVTKGGQSPSSSRMEAARIVPELPVGQRGAANPPLPQPQ